MYLRNNGYCYHLYHQLTRGWCCYWGGDGHRLSESQAGLAVSSCWRKRLTKALVQKSFERMKVQLTLSLCVPVRGHFTIAVLFQLFLTTHNTTNSSMTLKPGGPSWPVASWSHVLAFDSPFPAGQSLLSFSSGPAGPSPASCETAHTQKMEFGTNVCLMHLQNTCFAAYRF